MSKDSGSFLRKVVRFVANPTTDWSELDAPPSDPAESDYAKTEIKAMIERKRRNDFVRKRELDMLRKIRREGLNPDAALAMGSISNLDPESRPQSGARSDITVKAKIDEIELQMVGASGRNHVTPSQAAALPTVPGGSVDLPITAPGPLTQSISPSLRHDTPQVSQAVLSAARAQAPRMPGRDNTPAPVVAAPSGLQVLEMAHDPELDEAVIAFANADFDQCEQCLLTLVQPGALRHQDADTWMVLFDLYRALDLPHQFDNLAVSFAQHFGVSAPQWYSLPQRVAQHLERAEGAPSASASGSAAAAPGLSETDAFAGPSTEASEPDEGHDWDTPQPGWIAPAVLDQEGIALLRVAMLQLPRPGDLTGRI